MKIQLIKVNALSTVSEYKSLSTTNSDGGAFHLDVPGSFTLDVSDTTLSDNQAGTAGTSGNGAVFNINSATANVDLTLLRCTVNNNKALGGRGGFISIPTTSTSSVVTLTSSSFSTNEAKTDGGLFYIGGIGDKTLLMTDTSILTTKARTGNGGIAFL